MTCRMSVESITVGLFRLLHACDEWQCLADHKQHLNKPHLISTWKVGQKSYLYIYSSQVEVVEVTIYKIPSSVLTSIGNTRTTLPTITTHLSLLSLYKFSSTELKGIHFKKLCLLCSILTEELLYFHSLTYRSEMLHFKTVQQKDKDHFNNECFFNPGQ